MKRTILSLPDDLARALKQEARRRSVSSSALVSDALAAHLRFRIEAPRRPRFAALAGGGLHASAAAKEEMLAREWDDYAGRR
jgi:predicted transcriptional regulator